MSVEQTLTLITGANSGIGFELALHLLRDASNQVLLGARTHEKSSAAVDDLQARDLPGTVEAIQLDVIDENSVAAAAKLVQTAQGKLDALVNNAGIAHGPGTVAEQMLECFRVNAVGVETVTSRFAPLLRKSSTMTARVINITSSVGSVGNRLDHSGRGDELQLVPYRVSKAALHMVFACQCRDLEKDGMKVFLYGPGRTVSNLSPYAKEEYGAKPTSVAVEPIIEMLRGERDKDAGAFLDYGFDGHFPW